MTWCLNIVNSFFYTLLKESNNVVTPKSVESPPTFLNDNIMNTLEISVNMICLGISIRVEKVTE